MLQSIASTFFCPQTDPIIVERQLKAIKIYDRTVDLGIIYNPAIFTSPKSYGSLAAVSKANHDILGPGYGLVRRVVYHLAQDLVVDIIFILLKCYTTRLMLQ